jgi:cytochrome b involved in lipid metabolism
MSSEQAKNDRLMSTTGDDRVMNDSTLPRQVSPSPLASKQEQSSSSARRKVGRFGMADWTRLLANSKDLAQRKGQPLRRIRWEEIRQHATVHDGWIVLKNKVYNISPYMVYHPGGESILKLVLGKDATPLFDKYHRWISEEGYVFSLDVRLQTIVVKQSPTHRYPCRSYCLAPSLDDYVYSRAHARLCFYRLIGKLHIGYLDTTPDCDDSDDEDEKLSYLPHSKAINDEFPIPVPRPPKR